MIEFKAKLWRHLGSAAAVGLTGVALAACTPAAPPAEGPGASVNGEAGESAIGESGGESGGEGGEAGASEAYAGLEPAERTRLRLQHLKGFLLAAEGLRQAGLTAEAGVLVEQADVEIARGQDAELGALPAGTMAAAAAAAAANDEAGLKGAIAALDAAIAGAGAEASPEQVRRLLGLVRTVYAAAVKPDATDPIEYQHSYAAALAARDAFSKLAAARTAAPPARVFALSAEMENLLKLWPSPTAPSTPTPATEVAAQAARVELALSGI